jgi:predicted AlkP superfamily phosphohydrolase/phosphomutase
MDCLEPSLLETWKDSLPNFQRLLNGGISGPLESIIPPITVPAWTCMLSGKDPGELGIYGFRNRADHGYTKMSIATSRDVHVDRVWDILSRAGRRVAVVGVPQTYPPTPVNGVMIGDFLTPNAQSDFTYPAALKKQLEAWVGEYVLDVKDFRTEDKDWLLRQIYDMTERRFRVVRHLLRRELWDFFMMVEMGPDRIHHGFWSQMDPRHPKHVPGNRYQDAIRDYYRYLDRELGELLELVSDDTQVLLVSDHGAQTMEGGICFNDWLVQEGYLVLKEQPKGVVPIEKVEVDWAHTTAWGAGGYYGRLFLNVQGREPQGMIPPEQYEAMRDELIAKLAAMADPQGRPLGTVVYKPEQVYRAVGNIAPDLIVYFGNLAWRSVGSIGYGGIYTFENDTGPDDANHAQHGVFALYDPRGAAGRRDDLHILDVAPTILDRLGLPVPEGMGGKVVR